MSSSETAPRKNRERKRTGRIVLIFVVLALAADLFLNSMMAREYRYNQKISVNLELGAMRARLEERLNTNLFLVYSMAAYISVRSDITESEFQAMAPSILGRS